MGAIVSNVWTEYADGIVATATDTRSSATSMKSANPSEFPDNDANSGGGGGEDGDEEEENKKKAMSSSDSIGGDVSVGATDSTNGDDESTNQNLDDKDHSKGWSPGHEGKLEILLLELERGQVTLLTLNPHCPSSFLKSFERTVHVTVHPFLLVLLWVALQYANRLLWQDCVVDRSWCAPMLIMTFLWGCSR